MKKELEDKLFNTYPKILSKLAFFEIDDGWYDLVDYLLEELVVFDIQIVQCKEKFGSLRVYYDLGENLTNNEISKITNIIREYEAGSSTVCQVCGQKAGKKSCQGWLTTFCDIHHKEWLDQHSVK